MSINIVISDTVGFKVEGAINDAAGTPQPFDFSLVCKRLDSDTIDEQMKGDFTPAKVRDFFTAHTTGWARVRDAAGQEAPFSTDALASLLKIPGLPSLAFRKYIAEVGAKEKN